MTQLIDPVEYTKTLGLLRSFFLSKDFLEVHTQNRLSIVFVTTVDNNKVKPI